MYFQAAGVAMVAEYPKLHIVSVALPISKWA